MIRRDNLRCIDLPQEQHNQVDAVHIHGILALSMDKTVPFHVIDPELKTRLNEDGIQDLDRDID
jgi:hypothetical protein